MSFRKLFLVDDSFTFAPATNFVFLQNFGLEMIKQLIHIFLLLHASCSANRTRFEQFDDCTVGQYMGIRIMVRYFQSQYSIILVDRFIDKHFIKLRCYKGESALIIYSSMEKMNVGPKLRSSSVMALPTTSGIYIKSEKEYILNHFFPMISSYNPLMKLMFQFADQTRQTAEEVLRVGFEKYKLLNIGILVVTPDRGIGDKGSFVMYNPFSGSEIIRTPEYHWINLTVSGFEKQLNEINEFLDERVKNLRKYPLKVDIFPYPMVARPVRDDKGNLVKYSLVDGALVEALAQVMNFTPVFTNSSSSGIIYPNGSVMGSFAALENDAADLVANPQLIIDYPTKKGVFLQAITVQKYSFIIRKQTSRKQIILFMLQLVDFPSIIIAVSLTLSFPFLYLFTKKMKAKILGKKVSDTYGSSALFILGLTYNNSRPLPTSTSSRILVAVVLFYALIMTSVYQGSIVRCLHINSDKSKVKTMEDLIDRNYKFSFTSSLNSVLVKQSGGPLGEKLKQIALKKGGVLPGDGLKAVVENKNFAFLWADIYMTTYLDRYFDEKTGEDFFEALPQTAFEFYIAAMAPKSSPFLERFNDIILTFVESGLNIYHIDQAIIENDNVWYSRVKNNLIPKASPLTLSLRDMDSVFYSFLMAQFACFVVFILEYLFWRKTFKPKPSHELIFIN